MKDCFSSNSAAAAQCLLIVNEETAMKFALFLTAAISLGAAFAAFAPAATMPVGRPPVSAQNGIVQVHDSWRHDSWRDDRDWRGDRDWGDRRDWRRSEWRYERRHWRPWRAERWEERREWRRYDRDMPRLYRS
ncbi:hypothetical protein HJA87_17675 [Rhizobium bangladeshense]|uniref:BA14K family protein n=1 Tax=Rhizobium bangladeshense TaxID=1138189 RepID=A0ABS7LKW5_9HYPH|nr:hypothetical protein [Rhizobium bangladeshense]MBY3582445.1 hypothetical protein [Rhizobium bangladeshense]MBY3591686.1 hypothetical protein [Rhizobium bangladeshense]QSY90630.1 hypothetical protein J2J98_08230 [Rhizobium bangladeshense]